MKFSKIHSHENLVAYCDLWLPVWMEKGYELESYITKGIERFIIYTNTGKEIGCFELNPYYFHSSPVNDSFPFHHFPILKGKKVVELDKLALKKEYQGSIKRLIEIFNYLTFYLKTETEYDYLIGLLNPDLYNILVQRYKMPLIKLTDEEDEKKLYVPAMLERKSLEQLDFGQKSLKKYIQKV